MCLKHQNRTKLSAILHVNKTVFSKGLWLILNISWNEFNNFWRLCQQEWLLLTGRRSLLTKEDEDKIKAKLPHLQSIKANQLLLIDVFTGWSGPCNAVESHLRRMRHSFVEVPDCLALARACCDDIDDLLPFKQWDYLPFPILFSGSKVTLYTIVENQTTDVNMQF